MPTLTIETDSRVRYVSVIDPVRGTLRTFDAPLGRPSAHAEALGWATAEIAKAPEEERSRSAIKDPGDVLNFAVTAGEDLPKSVDER